MTADSPSLDELNAIMNLERQEAFDNTGGFSVSELSDLDAETPEEKLMRIIDKPLPGIPKEKQDLFKKSQAARKRSSRSRYSYIASGDGTVTTNRFQFDDPLNSEKQEWRRTLDRSLSREGPDAPKYFTGIRRVSSTSSGASQNFKTSPSVGSARSTTEKRLSSRSVTNEGTETASLTSNDTRNTTQERQGRRRGKDSSHSRKSLNQSPVESLSPATASIRSETTSDGHFSKSSFSSQDQLVRDRPPVPRRLRRAASTRSQPDDADEPRGRQMLNGTRTERRGSGDPESMRRSTSRDAQGNSRRTKSRDAPGNQSSSSKDAQGRRRSSRRSTRGSTSLGSGFEQVWAQSPEGDRVGKSRNENGDNFDTRSSMNIQRSMTSDSGKQRKTKLEKIIELQAKCDRYKKEWIEASKEKKKVRKELQSAQVDIVSSNMQIDTQKAEIEILQKQLTDTVQKLMEIQDVQDKDRAKSEETDRDIAQAKLDYTKAVGDTRELRTQIDKLEDELSDKDKQIESLNHDLFESKKVIGELKLDLNHADDEGIRLERELKNLEEELEAYKNAAKKDKEEGGVGDNLRQAHIDIEKRLQEEKERRLHEKQLKLESRIKEFEEQKEKAQIEQEKRGKEINDRQVVDSEKQKTRDEQRREMDIELTNRLRELEDTNTALQGRLKSQQLQSTIKLSQRDENIEKLTKSMGDLKKQLVEQEADPEGLVALRRQIETAKAEASSAQEDLAESQRMNSMLEEEFEDLQATSAELRNELQTLENEKSQFSTEMKKVKAKSDEWQQKSSEWTDKAFRWKEKSEYWERVCREIDPYYKQGGSSEPPPKKNEDPQAMMLQAAVQKKRSSVAQNPGGWNKWFNKQTEDQAESQAMIEELQQKNATQAELIKKLRSEIVRVQSSHKEETYQKQQQIVQVQREMEKVEIQNTNLVKQLELARKLEHFAAQDLTTTL